MSNLQGDLQFAYGDGQIFPFKSVEDYDFFAPPLMPGSLVSSHESWPTLESVSVYTTTSSPAVANSPAFPPSPSFDPTPSPDIIPCSESQTAAPAFTSTSLRTPNNSTRSRSQGHIPRPRNAFMIFRSEFWAEEKITRTVERDHRHISRIIGHCWNQMPEAEKSVWRLKAEQEKLEHGKKYPGYRFMPGSRAQKPVKRNVKRNGSEELLRCRQVAELLLAGKQGGELETAVRGMDPVISDGYGSRKRERKGKGKAPATLSAPASPNVAGTVKLKSPLGLGGEPAKGLSDSEAVEIPVFRSPLLPPSDGQQGGPSPQHGVSVIDNSSPMISASTYQPCEPGQFPLAQFNSPFHFHPGQYIQSQLSSSFEPPLYIPSQQYTPSQQYISYAPPCLNSTPQYATTNINTDTDTLAHQAAQYLTPYYTPVPFVDVNNLNILSPSSPSPSTSLFSPSFSNATHYDVGFRNPFASPQDPPECIPAANPTFNLPLEWDTFDAI